MMLQHSYFSHYLNTDLNMEDKVRHLPFWLHSAPDFLSFTMVMHLTDKD